MNDFFRRISDVIIPTVYSDALSYGEYVGRLKNKILEIVQWINNTKFVHTINGVDGNVTLGKIHFTGYVDKTYNGSNSIEVPIPTGSGGGTIAQLTFTGEESKIYDGTQAISVNIPVGGVSSVNGDTGDVTITPLNIGAVTEDDIPERLPNPKTLTFTQGNNVTQYDGSTPVNIRLPEESTTVSSVNGKTGAVVLNANDVNAIPNTVSKLPNPFALVLSGAVNATYDGTQGITVNIPTGGGGGVNSVNNKTGNVNLTATDVGAVPISDKPNKVVLTAVSSGSGTGSGTLQDDIIQYMDRKGTYLGVFSKTPIGYSFQPIIALTGVGTSALAVFSISAALSIGASFGDDVTFNYSFYRLDVE